VFDCALRFFAVASASMYEVESAAFIHQCLKARRRFGTIAVVLRLQP